MTAPNNWLQARPGFAWLFVLAPRPGLPEPKRWAMVPVPIISVICNWLACVLGHRVVL